MFKLFARPGSRSKLPGIRGIALTLMLAIATPALALTLVVEEDASTGWHGNAFKFDNRGFLRIEQWGSKGHHYSQDDDEKDDDRDDRDHNWPKWGKHPHHHQSFVRFDTSIIGTGLAADDLLQASLRIFISRVISGGTVHLHRVLQPWDEHSLSNWNLPAYESLPAASFTVDKADQGHFRYIDISDILRDWHANPSTNHGLALVAENANLWADSKENRSTSQPMTIELSLARVGPEGPQGIQGPPGPQGIQGVQGIQGEKGEQGDRGLQGIRGIQGIQGIQGVQGERGEQGETGEQGPPGEQGPVGPAGDQQRNVIRVALAGGDFTDIQAAIDSIPLRPVGGDPNQREVTPTLITVAPGEYFGQVRLRSNVHLRGAGQGQTRIYPTDFLDDCVITNPLVCILGVANVEISGLLLGGETPAGVPFAEADTAIAMFQSIDIRILNNRIVDLPEGIFGEQVTDVDVRHNRIPDPADAIRLSGNDADSTYRVADNRIDNGAVSLVSPGRIALTSNAILGASVGSQLTGILQATGNQILGLLEFNAEGPSSLTANILGDLLILDGPGRITVNGNTMTRLIDNGNAIIVGNDFLPDANGTEGNPIIDASNSSTIFANRFLGEPDGYAVHNLVSDHQIRLQSRDETVEIQAGNTRITVDADGDISIVGEDNLSITAGGDIDIAAGGDLNISAREVFIESDADMSIAVGGDLSLEANQDVDLEAGISLTATAGTTVQIAGIQIDLASNGLLSLRSQSEIDITAGAIVDINAAVIDLN